MMNVYLLVKSLIELIIIFAGLAALITALLMTLFTQLQIHKTTFAIIGFEKPAFRKWHRRSGWLTLGGFVLSRTMFMLGGANPSYPLEPGHFAHSFVSVVCALAILKVVWVTHREARWGMKRVATWWVTILIFGASFTILTCALGVWRWANQTVTWDNNRWLIYQAATVGHVGLAFTLIYLGRIALANRRRSNKIDANEEHEKAVGIKSLKTTKPFGAEGTI